MEQKELVKYELATLSDAPAIASMSRTEIEHGLGWQYRPPQIKSMIRERETVVLCARRNDGHPSSLLGFGVMHYQILTAHLIIFAVAPKFRRQGIGHGLLQWLEKTATVAGVETIYLEVRSNNKTARKFYENRGFKYSNLLRDYYRRPNGVNESAWRMQKTLGSNSH